MEHCQSHCLANGRSILLQSPARQSKICLLEVCSWKTRDWRVCFLTSVPRWWRVVPGCTDTLTLVGYACVQARQLLQSWHAMEGSLLVTARSQGEVRGPMDHRDGRQVSETSVTEAEYESLWAGSFWCLTVHPLFFF